MGDDRAGSAAEAASVPDDFVLRDGHARALLDASPDLVFARDRNYHFLFVNRAYADFIGSTPEEMEGRLDTDFWEVARGDAIAEDSRASDEATLAGQTLRRNRVQMSRGGEPRVFDMTKVPLRNARGEVYGLLSSAREVTDTFRAEEALRASEARYRLLLEHAPVAVFVHDGKQVVFANRAFTVLMGAQSEEELLGYQVAKIPSAADLPTVVARIRRLQEGQLVTPSMEFHLLRVDGRKVPIQAMATRCSFEGQPAIQVVMFDETARLAAHAAREVLEAQLRHAQRLEALGTLAGGIAHDFNNMLAVIAASAELARREVGAEHASHASLDEVLQVTDRASALVRGILAFSRKQPLERAAVHLRDVVHGAARLLRATLPVAVALDVEADAHGPSAVVDATQVHQALTNLCTNAWHAMGAERAGRIRITVDTVVVDEAAARRLPQLALGEYACVTVRDDGAGMDADTIARAFDPFFTTKAPGEGTGLGLSVVHGIMRGHGGAVTVSSEVGVGTEFRLYFPAAEAPAATLPSPAVEVAPAVVGARVLLVDDEPAVLAVLRRSLESSGFAVTAKGSFGDATAALNDDATAFDMIVSDYNMPGGSGLALAEIAKRLRPGLPVILMSGYLDERVKQQAVEVGVEVLLAKPFSIAELAQAVEQALMSRAKG